ncbi:hypothetical protein HK405_006383, partial [Cladochytrium tenue]
MGTHAAESTFDGMMQKNAPSAEYMTFKGAKTRLPVEVIRKRGTLTVALKLFGNLDRAIIKTFSQHKSSNLYRLLAFARRYLYFLRDKGHIKFEAALCQDLPRLFQSIARRVWIDEFDAWMRARKEQLFVEEIHLFEELDAVAEFGEDTNVEEPNDDLLSEEGILQHLLEREDPSSRPGQLFSGAVNPNSMANMLTDISTALRHSVEYYIISPMEISFEKMSLRENEDSALNDTERAMAEADKGSLRARLSDQKIQRDTWVKYVQEKTKAYRREQGSRRRLISSREAKIKLGRYPENGYDDLFSGYRRLQTVWMEPVVDHIEELEKQGLSRDAITGKIPIDDALCFQWGLIYGVLLLSATVRSDVLKALTWGHMDLRNFEKARLPDHFKTSQSCQATRSGVSFRASSTRGGTMFNYTMRVLLRFTIGLPSGGTHIFRDAFITKHWETGQMTEDEKQLLATQMLTSVEVLVRFYVHLNGSDMAKKAMELSTRLIPQLRELPVHGHAMSPPTTFASNRFIALSEPGMPQEIFGECNFCAAEVQLQNRPHEALSVLNCPNCKKPVTRGEVYDPLKARPESADGNSARIKKVEKENKILRSALEKNG